MGMDISFAPVGTAGGVLIRGISRCDEGGSSEGYKYFDGPCNCVRELLRACGVDKIKDLVAKPTFRLDALTDDGIMRLKDHEPSAPVPVSPHEKIMEWKATSRVGLSAPAKKPEQEEARKKFHLAPLRFLQVPFETKKEKTNIKTSSTGGVFTVDQYQNLGSNTDLCASRNVNHCVVCLLQVAAFLFLFARMGSMASVSVDK